MKNLKNRWPRVALSVMVVAGATAGVLLCLFTLSGYALEAQRTEPSNQVFSSDLHHTAPLTFTPVATTYLPIVLNAGSTVAGPLSLDNVTYWGYQIQHVSYEGMVDALVASNYDMLVLEPTRTEQEDADFDTLGMVTRLKNSAASDGTHRKLILAYIDIGQAEDWRWYWNPEWPEWDCEGDPPTEWPDYIITCDPDGWSGNYPVAYWDAAWKDIIIYGKNTGSDPDRDYDSVIDEVIKSGFDGIYLDWVEAFEETDVVAAALAASKDPANEMIDFIQEMRAYATARNPDFIIIQQNAASLIDGRPALTGVIDAIAQEAIWYDGSADVDWGDSRGYDQSPAEAPAGVISLLDQYLSGGLPVFDCEYALTHANTAYANALNKGYVPYVTRRSLSQLTTTPPPGYALSLLTGMNDFLYQRTEPRNLSSDICHTTPLTFTPVATSYLPLVIKAGSFDKWSLWTGSAQLRGANIYQRRVYPELDGADFMGPGPVGPPYIQKDFDDLAAMGANYVNISHPGLFAKTAPYALDEGIQTNLDNLLTMIAQADMFAVISFRTGPGRAEFSVCCLGDSWIPESYYNDSVWTNQSAQASWANMWRHTAERYKDNPIVVGYDLMVEPNSNEVLTGEWIDAEDFYRDYENSLADWNQFYPDITTAIREVDADTPILIGGMGYSALEWLPYLKPTGDSRTVYMVHHYDPFNYTHQDPPPTESYPDGSFDKAWLEEQLATMDTFSTTHSVPVAINEFGVHRWATGGDQYMDDQMDLFEQRGMNHALWMWDPSWAPWAEVGDSDIDAFNFRYGPNYETHTNVASSKLMTVISEHWECNAIHPSRH